MSGRRTHTVTAVRAFTLVEMLTVIAVLALLLMILVPSYNKAKELAYRAVCQSQMHQLANAVNINDTKLCRLPAPSDWVAHVTGRGVAGSLRCPKDVAPDIASELSQVYIQHNHFDGTRHNQYVSDIINQNPAADLLQIYLWHPSADVYEIYTTNVLQTGKQSAAWADADSAIRVTFMGPTVKVEGLNAPNWAPSGSNIFVYKGAEKMIALTGKNGGTCVGPPFYVGASLASYAMNKQVPSISGRPDQLLLLEYYRQTVATYGTDDLSVMLAPRHLGRANMATMDGSVKTMLPVQFSDAKLWKP